MSFPNFNIDPAGVLGRQLSAIQIRNMVQCLAYVQQLPYGRNADRSRPELVLAEKRGTCSSKHALLKQVAMENGIDKIKLMIGIYRMSVENTPGIGDELARHQLTSIPEAHCYLKVEEKRYDLTSPEADISLVEADLLNELEILPQQVTSFKVGYHQQYIRDWLAENRIPFTFDEVWAIRENCILRLSEER